MGKKPSIFFMPLVRSSIERIGSGRATLGAGPPCAKPGVDE
jgi:hypothetical protein